jgi:hypothetical protein
MFNQSTEYFCHHEAINQACDCYDQVIGVVKKAVATMEKAQFSYNQIHETVDSILFSFDSQEEVDNAAEPLFWKE